LTRPGDAAELAGALDRLLANPAEASRLGQGARQWAEEQFSLRRQVNSLLNLWSRMLEEPRL
jgi:glycosyltransferase involved in cell wall biosynthesis